MKTNVKHNEVKVRLTDSNFGALRTQSAALGLSHSALLGMLFIDWLKGCVKDSAQPYAKEVTKGHPKRGRFRSPLRPAFHPRM